MTALEPPDPVRSRIMRAIRGRDTKPEWTVRRLLHGLGYRYRLHRRDLPGTPDLAFPRRRRAVFVHGCFWHGHDCPRGTRKPKRNAGFWAAKIARNAQRDGEAQARLVELGWASLVVWECGLKDRVALEATLRTFLGPPGKTR